MAFSGGSGGSGTVGDPYQIADLTDLQSWDDNWATVADKYFILTANIDATATSGWNASAGWIPIGTSGTPFSGGFDGDGYAIDGIYIDRATTNYCGVIGYGAGCSLSNLSSTNVNITSQGSSGALLGYGRGATIISNCHSTGSISGTRTLGGLLGDYYSTGLTISKCSSSCAVTGSDNYIGGFIGSLRYPNITNCYATGAVVGVTYVGGFVGLCDSVAVAYSRCYSVGSVTGTSSVGGFSGAGTSTATYCFWDTETSGQATSNDGTGKTTAEMKLPATFTNWDFSTVWDINPTVTYPTFEPYGGHTLDTVDPVSGSVAGGTAITLTLSAYATGATGVTFGGQSATSVVVVNDTSITCVTPAHVSGAVDVVVTCRDTGTITKASGYEYLADASFSIEPPFGYILGGTPVVLKGSGFTGATGVTFGGDAATSVVVDSDTQISAITPAHAAGAVDIIVVIP
jgi:hypothetical protein